MLLVDQRTGQTVFVPEHLGDFSFREDFQFDDACRNILRKRRPIGGRRFDNSGFVRIGKRIVEGVAGRKGRFRSEKNQ